MWLERFFSLENRRRRLLQQTAAGPLHEFLDIRFADPAEDVNDTRFVSLDLETSGLDPQTDHILSIGFVELHHDCVDLSTAEHWVIRTDLELSEDNVVIHQLTDDVISQGISLSTAMAQLLPRLAGKVLLAHHAKIEMGFLGAACQRLFGQPLLLPVVDTLAIARQQMRRRHEIIAEGSLRLAALRQRYHLPRYKAHHALNDAIATAELFLAQVAAKRGAQSTLPLKSLLTKI